MPADLPVAVRRLAQRGAVPELVAATLARLVEDPSRRDLLLDGEEPTPLAEVVAMVVGASNLLARLLVRDARALQVLRTVGEPLVPRAGEASGSPDELARRHELGLLHVAARDLLGIDDLQAVGAGLSMLAADALAGAVAAAARQGQQAALMAVIGMGKLGGAELNYASDVDVLLVGGPNHGEEDGRRVLEAARRCFRVDADLRPEGRAGPLVRSLEGYRAHWARWVQPWERQALLKARPVAGDPALGAAFGEAAAVEVWEHRFTAEELAQIRAMKARTEALLQRRGLRDRDVKRGTGGIRDVEFSVQLLQLVHGRLDPAIRSRGTLPALAKLAELGYVAGDDAAALADGYRFLRAVEHRLQLVEGEQAYAVPAGGPAHRRLALVLGFADGPSWSASERFDEALRHHRATVRAVHERLYFRPLLEAFATLPTATLPTATLSTATPTSALPGHVAPRPSPSTAPVEGMSGEGMSAEAVSGEGMSAEAVSGEGMSAEAVSARLDAFGFAGAARTRAAVDALASGLTRSSRLMAQMLPLVLDWLSQSPDPDMGLQQLRDLVAHDHQRALLISEFRESPEAARRLCLLLGSSRLLGEALVRSPEVLALVGDDDALAPAGRADAEAALAARLRGRSRPGDRREQLLRFRREQLARVAARDLLGIDDVPATAAALTAAAEAVLQTAMEATAPAQPWCALGLGRFGGAELSYASDLDVLLVCAHETPEVAAAGEDLLALVHGPGAYETVVRLDLGLRPEGGHGRLVRDLAGYQRYFERWAQTWERQAMLRARVVAGDRRLGEQMMGLVAQLLWERPFTLADVADVRRMKARVERERISPHEDPRFHLKLGPGALADVEWTVQLLQLRNRVHEQGTMAAIAALQSRKLLSADDAEHLRAAYRFCEHTRNRWHLVGSLPGGGTVGDALPTRPEALGRLARSLGSTPADLRERYRRVTRRARAVVERIFYEMPERA